MKYIPYIYNEVGDSNNKSKKYFIEQYVNMQQ